MTQSIRRIRTATPVEKPGRIAQGLEERQPGCLLLRASGRNLEAFGETLATTHEPQPTKAFPARR
jgi:hypothetical protein